MNLDRLIHRIERALREGASDSELWDLSTEYAHHRTLIKKRLDKCVVLIHSQKDFAAFDLAEQPPSLFPMMEKLSFADEGKWRELCRSKGYALGPDWDAEQVELLESLYRKEISEDSPLFHEYRAAVRSRDDERTFEVLKKILKAHPAHAAANRHYLQLCRKMLDAKIDRLDGLIREGKKQEFLNLVIKLESSDWPIKPQGRKWEKALAARASMQQGRSPAAAFSNPFKALGSKGMKFVRYLRSLDLLPKCLILLALGAGAWFGTGYLGTCVMTLLACWALFGFRRA